MKWIKKGQIYSPKPEDLWGIPHSQGPTPLILEDKIRIYFAGRLEHTISLPTFLDVDIDDPSKILHINKKPLLALGNRGTFDEFGIIPCEVIKNGNQVWLYYTGWSRGTTVTYILSIGLAISNDGGLSFKKAYEGPIVDRTKDEPYMTMAPFIMRENDLWHMWYSSGVGFHETEGKYEPQYIIKYASSKDGINWIQPNTTTIKPKSINESNTRPSVIKIGDLYHMWFCYRGEEDYRGGKNSYRIGYAYSKDLTSWIRNDSKAGIDVSEDGWDSSIITYPYVFKLSDKYIMIYNGNGFGQTGFGYAELEI